MSNMEYMPTFTILAKDDLALRTIAQYREFALAEGLVTQAIEVQKSIDEIRQWRTEHPNLCHAPNHTHGDPLNIAYIER